MRGRMNRRLTDDAQERQAKEAAERAANGGATTRQSSGEVRVSKGASARARRESIRTRDLVRDVVSRADEGLMGTSTWTDISELALPRTMSIAFPNGKDDLLNFVISIKPDEGFYRGGTFDFAFAVPAMYPHEPPKVRCEQKVYHPNIDLDGNVCLNILREDWKPVLTISSVLFGLSLLFSEPNPDDPLNKEAAQDLAVTPHAFELNVRRAMQGGYVGQHRFTRCVR